MKRIKQYKFFAVAFAVLALASCNYEEINTNPFEMTDGEGVMDGIVVGGYITAMQKSVLQVRLMHIKPHTICLLMHGAAILE